MHRHHIVYLSSLVKSKQRRKKKGEKIHSVLSIALQLHIAHGQTSTACTPLSHHFPSFPCFLLLSSHPPVLFRSSPTQPPLPNLPCPTSPTQSPLPAAAYYHHHQQQQQLPCTTCNSNLFVPPCTCLLTSTTTIMSHQQLDHSTATNHYNHHHEPPTTTTTIMSHWPPQPVSAAHGSCCPAAHALQTTAPHACGAPAPLQWW